MTLLSMLTERCDVARNQPLGTNGRHEFQSVATGVACKFLPLAMEVVLSMNFTVGSTFTVYMASASNVLPADRLTKDGKTYLVRSVNRYEHNSKTSHFELIVETEKSNE